MDVAHRAVEVVQVGGRLSAFLELGLNKRTNQLQIIHRREEERRGDRTAIWRVRSLTLGPVGLPAFRRLLAYR